MTALQMIFACLLVVGFVLSGMSLMNAHARNDQMQKRVSAVVGVHTRIKPVGMSISLFAEERKNQGLIEALTRIFGFSLDKQNHYRARWYVVLLVTGVIAYFVCAIGSGIGGAYVRFLSPLAWVLFSRMFFGWCENTRQDKLFRQFPDALAMIVRSVRVGIPVTEAVRAVAREVPEPTGPEFQQLADELAIGMGFDEALLSMSDRNGLPEYRFFATALSLQAQTGGTLSETLENLAEVIRKRVAVRERGKALASEAKTSAGILAALPPLSGLGLWILNPQYIGLLFHDPAGKKVLAVAITMLFGGIMVMRTIIRKTLQ